jgi:folate-binding protein YgfZ
MTNQPSNQARLAAYCSAKGRMLASFQSLRPAADTYWLITDLSVLPATLKRLSMFVLRAKVKLQDGAASLAAVGLLGAVAADLAAGQEPGSVWADAARGGLWTRLPDVSGLVRCLWIGPKDQQQDVLAAYPAVDQASWQWLDVVSGVPRIEAAGSDQFVPQMVNFELVGGVNFSKGCYPGQEVVARSQYRGTLKRRAFVVHGGQAMAAGQELFSAADPGQPAGMVVNAAPCPGSANWSALVELKLNALDTALHVGAADGPQIQLGKLPYEIPSAD